MNLVRELLERGVRDSRRDLYALLPADPELLKAVEVALVAQYQLGVLDGRMYAS